MLSYNYSVKNWLSQQLYIYRIFAIKKSVDGLVSNHPAFRELVRATAIGEYFNVYGMRTVKILIFPEFLKLVRYCLISQRVNKFSVLWRVII